MSRRLVLAAILAKRCKSLSIYRPDVAQRKTDIPRNSGRTSPFEEEPSIAKCDPLHLHDGFCCFGFCIDHLHVHHRFAQRLLSVAVVASVTFVAIPANAFIQPASYSYQANDAKLYSMHPISTSSILVSGSTLTTPLSTTASPNLNNALISKPFQTGDHVSLNVKTTQQMSKPPSLPHGPINNQQTMKGTSQQISILSPGSKKGTATLNTQKLSSQAIDKQQIPKPPSLPRPPAMQTQSTQQEQKTTDGEFQPIDVKKITYENKIEVELQLKDQSGTVKIDRETFQKVKTIQPKFLQYLPSSMQPLLSRQFQSLKVLKEIPDDQLFEASVLAGSLTEIIRSTLTYPLGTVKARVQSRRSMSIGRRSNRTLLRKLRVTWLTFVYETKRGDLFAGLLPTLLITIPASGVYSGVKEVSRRAIAMGMQSQFLAGIFTDDSEMSSYVKVLSINLSSVLIADVASLIVRTPADVLALRRQVFGLSNVRSDYTDWVKDSVLLLPAMIITDLPYLMSRIFLNAAITTSGENLGRYEVETIIIACLCAFLTTPFDVARTRILLPALPSEDETRKRLSGSSKYRKERRQKLSVLSTMRHISKEGNGGVQNLFAGWLERTVFLGLGRAWLDPIRFIGYLGLRDAILLKFFD